VPWCKRECKVEKLISEENFLLKKEKKETPLFLVIALPSSPQEVSKMS